MMDEQEEVKSEPEAEANETVVETKKTARVLSMKVSAKGALSVYGLGRFPVTLYKEQWLRLLAMSDDLRAFIKENEGALKSKSPS